VKNVIGLGGIAQSGKDFFFTNLKKTTKRNVIRFAIADELKKELFSLIKNTYNIDIFNCSAEDKEKIRPMLLSHGKIRRNESKGRHWINKISEKVKDAAKDEKNIVVITDIRYDEFANDEVDWVKKELSGFFVHISKYTEDKGVKVFGLPPNEDEAINNPKLIEKADYLIQWPDKLKEEQAKIYCNEVLIHIRLSEIYDSIKK
jgi:hypothetical protein